MIENIILINLGLVLVALVVLVGAQLRLRNEIKLQTEQLKLRCHKIEKRFDEFYMMLSLVDTNVVNLVELDRQIDFADMLALDDLRRKRRASVKKKTPRVKKKKDKAQDKAG